MTRLLVVLLGMLFLSHAAESGEVGVCYGTEGNNLPSPTRGAQLMMKKGITKVRVYDTNRTMMTALANTGIKVATTLPNECIAAAAADPKYAEQWVRQNVEAFYPATRIETVCVGNEVFNTASQLTPKLVPAMKNVYKALHRVGLADAVKVTTPVAFNAFKNTFPPSASVFQDDLAESVMSPMLDFLDQTGSYLTVNIFPYLAYVANAGNISLDYLLFRPNSGVHDQGSNLMYYSLFDAQLDAVYYAMDKLPSSGSGTAGRKLLRSRPQGKVMVGETNVPHPRRGGTHKAAEDDDDPSAVATVENSKAYVGNLINRVVDGETTTCNRGTPYRPDADINVYIFDLFNENLKKGPNQGRAQLRPLLPGREARVRRRLPRLQRRHQMVRGQLHGRGQEPPGRAQIRVRQWCCQLQRHPARRTVLYTQHRGGACVLRVQRLLPAPQQVHRGM